MRQILLLGWISTMVLVLAVGCSVATSTADQSADAAVVLAALAVPPHPRAKLTMAELQGHTADQDDGVAEASFSVVPPPHPRVGADGEAAVGSDGLMAHAPLPPRSTPRPTATLIGNHTQSASNGDADEDSDAAGSAKVAAVTLTRVDRPTATATPTEIFPTEIPSTGTAAPTEAPTDAPTAIPTEEPTEAPTAQIATFTVLTEESTITYQVNEEFTSIDGLGGDGQGVGGQRLVTGKTQQVEGELTLDLNSPPSVESGYFEVNIASLTSRDPRRDLAIQAEWLESNRYPIASFEIDELQNGPESWTEEEPVEFQLAGTLTIRDVTNDAIFDVNATLTDGLIRGTATAEIRMTDYGFEPPAVLNLVTAQDEVTLIIYLTAVED